MTAHTVDAFYSGRIKVYQPEQGFRAGTDSLLLASALDCSIQGEVLEMGCGSGGALLPAAHRLKQARLTGLEIDPAMAALAHQGARANGFQDRVEIVQGNANDLENNWQNRFELVFSNPPFFETGTIQAPGTGKEAAYLENVSLKDWINAMLFALRHKGTFVMVHRAADLARILSIIERQTGEITVLPIHSYPGAEAKRVLVRARKGLRSGPMRLLEPRYLYEEKGGERRGWTLDMQRNGAEIDWN
ncbi:MAG: methyltransferase domain-containing protein [Alphaproteobacteria bacterium]|nr:methyltransferase domain-containing protein [Alphaproteobacteria bacterium]